MDEQRPIPRGSRQDRADDGQTLVEYTLIIAFVILVVLGALLAFQSVVVDGLWATVEGLTEAL